MASQMKPAQYDETILTIGTGQPIDIFRAKVTILTFEGYRTMYTEADEEEASDEESVISPVAVGTTLRVEQMQGKQTYRQPPKRFDEATLVKSMEQKGIGRPSTYASILTTIQKRVYAETGHVATRKMPATIITLKQGTIRTTTEQQSVGGDKAKLVPTATGIQLADFLEANFSPLVDYGFTASMEKQLDEIVEGKSKFLTVIQS
jgi:DNA topoisomerase-1